MVEHSTSLAGQLLMLGIPNLNKVYEDDEDIVIVHYYGNKYIIHSERKVKGSNTSFLKKAKIVNEGLLQAFKAKGITRVYTWSETPEQERYNKFLGYTQVGDPFYAPNYNKELKEWVTITEEDE